MYLLPSPPLMTCTGLWLWMERTCTFGPDKPKFLRRELCFDQNYKSRQHTDSWFLSLQVFKDMKFPPVWTHQVGLTKHYTSLGLFLLLVSGDVFALGSENSVLREVQLGPWQGRVWWDGKHLFEVFERYMCLTEISMFFRYWTSCRRKPRIYGFFFFVIHKWLIWNKD